MNILRILFLFLSSVGFVKFTLAEGGLYVSPNRFWKEIQPLHAIDYKHLADSKFSKEDGYKYYLRRHHHNGKWVLIGNGNGQIWELEENYQWKRIDKTIFRGHDFNSYSISEHHKYGGYGYWRAHGLISQFDLKSLEWVLIKANREIARNENRTFMDHSSGLLYQLGIDYRNQGLFAESSVNDSVYAFSMSNSEWEVLGTLNPVLSELLITKSKYFYNIHYTDGLLFIFPFLKRVIFINFPKKVFYEFNHQTEQAVIEFMNKNRRGHTIVPTEDYLYAVLDSNYEITDSLEWEFIFNGKNGQGELIASSQQSEGMSLFIYAASLFLAAGLIFIGRKKLLTKINWALKANNKKLSDVPKTNHFDYKLTLSENAIFINNKEITSELSNHGRLILHNLISNKIENKFLNTLTLNELLGIDSRSPDNQKKIRSEAIKSINSILNQYGFEHEAILRKRLDDDRRMVIYFLNELLEVENLK